MKHIFKKLHHHPNRSNETPSQPSPSSSGGRTTTTSSPSTATSSVASTAISTSNTSDESNRQQQLQSHDYFSSEEEYQVQLALALSVSSSSSGQEDKTPIRPQQVSNTSAADLLSRRYWTYGVIDFEERVVDGFYDLHSLSADLRDRGDMPSIQDIERNNGLMDYEVVVVNRTIDPALEELMQIASCILLDCPTAQNSLLIQRLAELVTSHLGGPADANLMLEKWRERSMGLRTSHQTSVVPIGSLKTGLLCHRALLFKVLADSVGLACRLLKGSHYGGTENDAFNVIKLQDDCEWLVDLMGAPGTLIPADALSAHDTPSKSCNPKTSAAMFRNPEALVSSSDSSTCDGGGTIEPNVCFSTANQSVQDLNGSSLYQGRHGSVIAGNSARLTQNAVPYDQKSAEDPRNLFADLNPFHQEGSARTAGLYDLSSDVHRSQFPKNRNVSGRPPVPLTRKNQHEWNESSVGSRNSNVPSVASMLPQKPLDNHVEMDEKIPLGSKSKLAIGEAKTSQLLPYGSNDGDIYNRDKQDARKVQNIIRGTSEHNHGAMNLELKEAEGASSMYDLGASYVDIVIDDVGEREILWEDLVIGERIGLGSYGEVYRADWNGTEVAVKKFLDQDFSGAALDEFKREVRIMRRLRHQNVVLFMGAVTRPPNLSIVTEFLPLGSLYRIIHRPNCQIDEKRRIRMALDVARGMNCLHTSIPTIVHRDLKSQNLLVDNNWNVKVCDFGLSRLKHNTFLSSKSTAGTPEWMAPEVLRNEPSNEKCDVYSFGVILWELATLKLPWTGMNAMQVVGAVGFQNRRLDIPKEVDPLVGRIIWECWQMDPNLRPSFAELIEALKPLQCLAVPSQ